MLKKVQKLDPALIHLTRQPGDAKAHADQACREGCDYVVAGGGDGTLNEIINGIANRSANIRVGLVPLGTANDFARCLNLPVSLEESIDILQSAETTQIDLVRVQSDETRYFANVSAGGFSGVVDEKLTPEMKRAWGPLAYVRSAAAAFHDLHAYRTIITLDDEETLAADLYNVIVANGRFVAGGLPIAPEADPADGLLDVILIPRRSKPEMVLLAAQVLLGNHLQSDAIMFRRAKKLAIKSLPGMCFNVDGEFVGNSPTTFEVMPRALQFVVPKR